MRRFWVLLTALVLGLQAGAVKVGVLLPLKEKAAMGQTLLEFYRGFLLAVDSVKHEGLSVDIYTLDPGTTVTGLEDVLSRGALQDADVIFGPGVSAQVNALATYCQAHGIRMVMPFAMPCAQIGQNPYVFQAALSQESLYPDVAQLVMENLADANFVMLRSDEHNARGTAFQAYFQGQVKSFGLPHSVLSVNADDGGVETAMNVYRPNVVVLDSPSETALRSALSLLRRFRDTHPYYRLSLLGYPDWLNLVGRYGDDFHAFDAYVYSPFYSSLLSGRIVRFTQKFRQSFGVAPSQTLPSAAMLGFDLVYRFLNGVNPMPLQQDFDFRKVSEQGGEVNRFVQLIHYGKNKLIQILR